MESFEREDLKNCNREFEVVWIEIKNKKSKNIIVGCTYRHPHNNLDDYILYINKYLQKLHKENKEVDITGDFNIDLLKYDKNVKYQEFYNLMTSNGFLPQILLPTRVTDSTMTIIDNIYTRVTDSTMTIIDNIYTRVTDSTMTIIDNIYTRVTDSTMTIIDNIYTRVTDSTMTIIDNIYTRVTDSTMTIIDNIYT